MSGRTRGAVPAGGARHRHRPRADCPRAVYGRGDRARALLPLRPRRCAGTGGAASGGGRFRIGGAWGFARAVRPGRQRQIRGGRQIRGRRRAWETMSGPGRRRQIRGGGRPHPGPIPARGIQDRSIQDTGRTGEFRTGAFRAGEFRTAPIGSGPFRSGPSRTGASGTSPEATGRAGAPGAMRLAGSPRWQRGRPAETAPPAPLREAPLRGFSSGWSLSARGG
jgi:hypothetical protein